MDADLIKLLEQTGFTQKEAQVYLALLELGEGTVTKIAKTADLKRSIIYVILESLIKRGYVQQVQNKKVDTFRAMDPSVILVRLKSTTQNLNEMLPFLRTLGNKGKDKPKITYFDTKEDILRLYDDFTYVSSATPNIFIASYARMDEFMPGMIDRWIKYYHKKRHRKTERHLLSDTKQDIAIGKRLVSYPGQEVRVTKALRNITMDFSILENKLIITSFSNKPFIVIIESLELVDSMLPIFEIAWASAKELDTRNP